MVRPLDPWAANATLPDMARVHVTRREAPGIVTHEIVWPDWPGCAPGQFNMLSLPDLGEVPVSVSGGTAATGRVFHTIRSVGPVSAALTGLVPGAALTIRGPYGCPWPLDLPRPRPPVLIVAEGLGVASLRPVIRHHAREVRHGLPVHLLIGAREPNGLVSWRDYDGWRAQGVDLLLTVANAPPEWPWHVGAVAGFAARAVRRSHKPPVAYVCGPEAMTRATALNLVEQGVAPADIFLSFACDTECGLGPCADRRGDLVLPSREGPVLSWQRAGPLIRGDAP
jgi:NAD(P)H-flavin reductase